MAGSTHPLRERPDLPLEQRIEVYRNECAKLMDFVWWWVKLSEKQREEYRKEGFPDITLEL